MLYKKPSLKDKILAKAEEAARLALTALKEKPKEVETIIKKTTKKK